MLESRPVGTVIDVGFFMKLGAGTSGSGSGGLLGGIADVFSPSRKHTVEQQDHERIARPRDDSDGPGPVDLDNSEIVIKRPSR